MKIGPLSAARARLFEWGSCVRSIIFAGAPHPSIYSEQPFTNERINFDFNTVDREIFKGARFDRAIETDEWIDPIKLDNPTMYEALVVRYVDRMPAGRHITRQEQQVFEFNQRTGLGMTAYYARLKKAETYIAMYLS